ncbi:MAG TPA: hydroxymethylbilane synthase [Terriglobales bacterium]
MTQLKIGSRGSQLALWQANHVAGLLRRQGHEVAIEVIKTTGDKITEVALSKVGTKGMFTKEIEEALAEGRVDLAVHSLKDVPTVLAAEFVLAAIMEREDARDVFLSRRYSSIAGLPQNARIGTSSLRRVAQLKAMRPDLETISLRGNVDTRLRKLEAGEYDGIILAAAGVKRLQRAEWIRELVDMSLMCPAAGQGALAVEARSGDQTVLAQLEFLDHGPSRRAVTCERAALNALGGGCQVPIGAYATENADLEITLRAMVARPDGSEVIREQRTGSDPEKLGAEVGAALLAKGAGEVLQDVYRQGHAVPQQP